MSFAPDESASDLWLERSFFAGTILGAASYGVHLAVFTITFYSMLKDRTHRRAAKWFYTYLWAMFALGTIQAGANAKYAEEIWVDDRGIDGGPLAWLEEHFGDPVNTLASSAYVVATMLADGMLLYRLLVVWNYKWYIGIIPGLTWIASTILSAFAVFQSAQPGSSFWSSTTIQLIVPYFSMSIGLNILMTLGIAGRMLYLRRGIVDVLGPQHAKLYTGIAAMFVESGAVYSIWGLIFIICYARNSNVQNIVLGILDQAVCIAPELILLRVATGTAWSRDTTLYTTGQLSDIKATNVFSTDANSSRDSVKKAGTDIKAFSNDEQSKTRINTSQTAFSRGEAMELKPYETPGSTSGSFAV